MVVLGAPTMAPGDLSGMWSALVDYPVALAVIAVVVFFIRYVKGRDSEAEARAKRLADDQAVRDERFLAAMDQKDSKFADTVAQMMTQHHEQQIRMVEANERHTAAINANTAQLGRLADHITATTGGVVNG